MDNHQKQQLDALMLKRDSLRDRKQRLQGMLDVARSELSKIEEKLREKNIPPEKLDLAISQLQARFTQAMTELTDKIGQAEEKLAPFLEERG